MLSDVILAQIPAEQHERAARLEQAIAVNPVYENEKLQALSSWDAPGWAGLRVVVLGYGESGRACADVLSQLGAHIVVLDGSLSDEKLEDIAMLNETNPGSVSGLSGEAAASVPLVEGAEPDVVVVSPGIAPFKSWLLDCYERQIQVWGDIELAWRLNERASRPAPGWLCLTGTNGKTTTVGMVDSILKAAGKKSVQVGNVGNPAVYEVANPEIDYDFFAVELSSYQLHWTYSLAPVASIVLNVAPDHLNWHGSFEAYSADKARIYRNTQVACIFNLAHEDVLAMVEEADVQEGARAIAITTSQVPQISMLGFAEELMVDRAFLKNRYNEAIFLAEATDLSPIPGKWPAKHTAENALAAAALTRAAGIDPEAVRAGLISFKVAPHRNEIVAHQDDILWVNDSKATNPHAANASLSAYPSVVWIAGGQSKGVSYDELVSTHAPRLKQVVVIGTDTSGLRASLSKFAPHVPVHMMTGTVEDSRDGQAVMVAAVQQAAAVAQAGDTVLLAPASASQDQFRAYTERGDAFAREVRRLLGA